MFKRDGEVAPIDININIYCIIRKKYIITPTESLCKNYGRDGSGVHCGVDTEYDPLVRNINKSESFEYRLPIPFKMRKENRKIQAGIDGSLKFRDNVKVLQNLILREILGCRGYHIFIQKQNEYRRKRNRPDAG